MVKPDRKMPADGSSFSNEKRHRALPRQHSNVEPRTLLNRIIPDYQDLGKRLPVLLNLPAVKISVEQCSDENILFTPDF